MLLSASRGGMISLAVAFVVTTALVMSHRRVKGSGGLLLVIGLMIFAGLVYLGSDAALERLWTLRNISQAAGDRWQEGEILRLRLERVSEAVKYL